MDPLNISPTTGITFSRRFGETLDWVKSFSVHEENFELQKWMDPVQEPIILY